MAEVSLRSAGRAAAPTLATGADGTFALDRAEAHEGSLLVRAPGFAPLERAWSLADEAPLVLVLEPARLAEEVTVTATRTETRTFETASRVVVLSRDDLDATPALTVDDALRQVPGFSLFRRSGSRVANPTTQGSSLRGLGPSGASRTGVLIDGLPLNDAFGGWAYWSRVPRVAPERIEVLEGGASDLYGSAALGGVIQVFTRSQAPAVSFEGSAGNEDTAEGSLYAAGQRNGWGARLAAEAFTTDGYVLVSEADRGAVDTPAGASHLNGVLTVDRRFSPTASAFVRGSFFGESRTNGTPLQANDTDLDEFSGGADFSSSGAGSFTIRAVYGDEAYHQTFSSLAADRESEALTRLQSVPSTTGGFTLQWSRAAGSHQSLVAGLEGRWVHGRSDETVYSQGQATSFASAGGSQQDLGAFAEDRVSLGARSIVTLGLRVDNWRQEDGSSSTTPIGSGPLPATVSYPDHAETALSPRASFLFEVTPRLALTAAGYGAFRAPTLNELYRSFRQGNTLTLANPALTAERSTIR
jgi:outer membrane receptor protein involved in Fe transport